MDYRRHGAVHRRNVTAAEIKSASASVGALALAAMCLDIERTAKADPATDLAPRVETLLAEAHRVLGAVRAMLRP